MRICTYNIHAGRNAQNQPSLPAVGDALAGIEPDLCLLQEVDRRLPRSGFQDQAGALGEQLGMRAYFYGRLRFGTAAFGNALLTRLPVRTVRRFPLPSRGGEPRCALGVQLEDGTWVWNTHLGLRAEWRKEQLVALTHAADGPPAVLLGGDFNATLDEAAVQGFLASASLYPLSDEASTFPAANPAHRIDFLFGRGYVRTDGGTIAAPGSDHCLVWATVKPEPVPPNPASPSPRPRSAG